MEEVMVEYHIGERHHVKPPLGFRAWGLYQDGP